MDQRWLEAINQNGIKFLALGEWERLKLAQEATLANAPGRTSE
ncbi:hypothetical protein [Paraburkholderia sp. GAS334]